MVFLAYCFGAIVLGSCLQLLLTRYQKHLRSIPGPLAASFSNSWKIAAMLFEDMPGWNLRAHETYGKVVRIGPSHISFASPEAFHAIYATRQEFTKSEFYAVGAPTYRDEPLENLFSIRDAQRHSALRRHIGGLYTKTAARDFEPQVDSCTELFVNNLLNRTRDGPATLDMSLWLQYFAYDCLSDINVSKKLGFLDQELDVDKMIESSDKIFYLVGLFTQAPALQRLLRHTRSLRPAEEAEPILKFTIREVESRRKSPDHQTDMLGKLLGLHLQNPEKASIRDLIGAIFINLTAGHDVLATTLRAILYYLAHNNSAVRKLRAEIHHASNGPPSSSTIPFSEISNLPYLNAVIQEALRVHPNTGTIIERKAPPGGAMIDSYYILGGTTVGVNAWVLHRNQEVFGHDAAYFRPERWLEANEAQRLEMNRCLFSFGAGVHTCIGQNIAHLMISKVVAEFYRRYDATLAPAESGQEWEIHGSWVTKQTGMNMVISKVVE